MGIQENKWKCKIYSEETQTQRDKHCMSFFISGFSHQNFRFMCLNCHACRSQKLQRGHWTEKEWNGVAEERVGVG